jgi:ribonuclease BN (tRNA processing enzyme)
MRLTFLGTGAAMPTARRQTGLLVEGGDRPLLVDCGAGVLHRLADGHVGYENVDTVLLTHHHLDHVADLLPLLKARWLAGEESLHVLGPAGTRELVEGLLEVHDYLDGRVDLRVDEVGPGAFSVAGLDARARRTRHSMPCLAYRLTAGDDAPVLTYSGDTEADPELLGFADGSTVLVHDCSFPDGVEVSNHPTPTALGEALADAAPELGRVYLTHFYPHADGREEEMVATVADHHDVDVRAATDGTTVEVTPTGRD